MLEKRSIPLKKIAVLLVILAAALSLSAAPRRTLILNGESTEALVVYRSGHPYVDLEGLAKALHGSISSSGPTVALSLPEVSDEASETSSSSPSQVTSSAAPEPVSTQRVSTQPAPYNPGFSREFLHAAIEEMSILREWHSVLQTAIQNQIPLSEGLFQPYRLEATRNLGLASVAATTADDHSAFELLNNVYVNMANLSDKYVSRRASLIYIDPDALQNDELNAHIVNCGRFLGAMAASGQFSDDGGSCQ